jgi:hypothetical protein
MDIGKPKRIIEVKPESTPIPTPVPSEPAPVLDPAEVPAGPAGSAG